MGCPDLKTCVLATAEDHCSHWMSFSVTQEGKHRLREDCAINWLAHFLYDSNVKLEGIQQPTEQTRNILLNATQTQRKVPDARTVQALHNGPERGESNGLLGQDAAESPASGGGKETAAETETPPW